MATVSAPVWDYINMGMSLEAAQEQWKKEHPDDGDDGSGSGSGSSPSTGCGRRRRVAN